MNIRQTPTPRSRQQPAAERWGDGKGAAFFSRDGTPCPVRNAPSDSTPRSRPHHHPARATRPASSPPGTHPINRPPVRLPTPPSGPRKFALRKTPCTVRMTPRRGLGSRMVAATSTARTRVRVPPLGSGRHPPPRGRMSSAEGGNCPSARSDHGPAWSSVRNPFPFPPTRALENRTRQDPMHREAPPPHPRPGKSRAPRPHAP